MSATINNCEFMTQEDFATQYHDEVVFGFLRRKKLPMDEFYDVVVFGFLEAIDTYLSRPELREKHCFEAIATVKMRDKLSAHWKYANRPKRKAPVRGLHEPYHGYILEESIADKMQSVEDAAVASEVWERIAPQLTQKQMDTLLLKSRGFTYGEIASKESITRSGVASRMFRIRSKAKACLSV